MHRSLGPQAAPPYCPGPALINSETCPSCFQQPDVLGQHRVRNVSASIGLPALCPYPQPLRPRTWNQHFQIYSRQSAGHRSRDWQERSRTYVHATTEQKLKRPERQNSQTLCTGHPAGLGRGLCSLRVRTVTRRRQELPTATPFLISFLLTSHPDRTTSQAKNAISFKKAESCLRYGCSSRRSDFRLLLLGHAWKCKARPNYTLRPHPQCNLIRHTGPIPSAWDIKPGKSGIWAIDASGLSPIMQITKCCSHASFITEYCSLTPTNAKEGTIEFTKNYTCRSPCLSVCVVFSVPAPGNTAQTNPSTRQECRPEPRQSLQLL